MLCSEEGGAVVEREEEADHEHDEVEHVLLRRRLRHIGQPPDRTLNTARRTYTVGSHLSSLMMCVGHKRRRYLEHATGHGNTALHLIEQGVRVSDFLLDAQ